MSLFSKFTTILAVATTAALGSAGCVAEGEDPTEESTEASVEEALSPEEDATETASEALTSSDWSDGCGSGNYCFDGGRRHYDRYERIDRYEWWQDSGGRYWNDDCNGRSAGFYCSRNDYDLYDRYRDRHHFRGRGRGHYDRGGW